MNIFWYPHYTLTVHSEPIALGQVQTKQFLNNISGMFEAMYRHKGVGLAGPQVGWNKRVLIMNPYGRTAHNRGLFIINPEVIVGDKLSYDIEGCLSLPNIMGRVARPTQVYLKSLLPNGTYWEAEFNGFEARILLHELDHLDGLCFIDRLEEDERKRVEPQLNSLQRFIEGVRKKKEEKEEENGNR